MKGRLALAENQMDKAVDTLDMVSEPVCVCLCVCVCVCQLVHIVCVFVCVFVSLCTLCTLCVCVLCDPGVGIISHTISEI